MASAEPEERCRIAASGEAQGGMRKTGENNKKNNSVKVDGIFPSQMS